MATVQTGWSADGNWFWDGAKWNDALSEDGKWRFDGNNWQAFAGTRTPMPAQPFNPPFQAAAPAGPFTDPQPEMPSWVAASEVERIQREKIEQQIAYVTPAAPLPPERDWRRVGEFMEYSHTPTIAFWRVGWTSLVIYLLLLWFCSPVAVIYVWLTAWGLYTKVYRTVISLIVTGAAISYAASRLRTG